jgi:signal transduction histidine kinase
LGCWARELHDVVSHAISVTVLQARGARRTLGTDQPQVREALDAIEQTNTAALSDMRRLLVVLRDTEQDQGIGPGTTDMGERVPQPSLAHLDGLVDRVRASGLPVDVVSLGTIRAVPPRSARIPWCRSSRS